MKFTLSVGDIDIIKHPELQDVMMWQGYIRDASRVWSDTWINIPIAESVTFDTPVPEQTTIYCTIELVNSRKRVVWATQKSFNPKNNDNLLIFIEAPPPPEGISWAVPVVIGSIISLFALGVYSSRKR